MAATSRDNTPAIDEAIAILGTETDQAAWTRVAKERKFEVNGGEVWGYTDGRVLPLPAPTGFALLPASSQNLFFAAATQYVLTRVGQTATGNVKDAIAKAMSDGDISDPKGYGAFEQAYRKGIEALIVTKVDPNFSLTVKGDTAKTAENRKNFEATVESQRAARFDKIVATAKANVMREAGETKPRKAAPKGTAFEIGGLDDAAE
jgi:hypothetical protein